MSLKQALEANKPTDRGGSVGSNRLTYQLSWALCRLLELHKSGKDYVMIFDYHDDIAVVDSAISPTKIDLYQVKTKDVGTWSLSELIRRKKSKKRKTFSILGKMYSSKIYFSSHTNSISLISNTKFSIKLTSNADSVNLPEICLKDLEQSELKRVSRKIQVEHSCSSLMPYEDITFFKVTDLSLRDHEKHALAHIVEFLEGYKGSDNFRFRIFQKTIVDEIRAKNNYEWNIVGFDNIVKYKSVDRSFVQTIVERNNQYPDLNAKWAEIASLLQIQGVHFSIIKSVSEKWREFEIRRMDENNITIQQLRKDIQTCLAKSNPTDFTNLLDFVSHIKQMLNNTTSLNDDLLSAAILMEYHE